MPYEAHRGFSLAWDRGIRYALGMVRHIDIGDAGKEGSRCVVHTTAEEPSAAVRGILQRQLLCAPQFRAEEHPNDSAFRGNPVGALPEDLTDWLHHNDK